MVNQTYTYSRRSFSAIAVAFMLLITAADAKEINISVANLPKKINPLTATDSTSQRILQLSAPSLLGSGVRSPKGYALAQHVSRNADASRYTVTLKKDTSISLNAFDIKDYYAKIKTSVFSNTLHALRDISVTDKTTLVFHLNQSDPWFYRALNLPIAQKGPYHISEFSDQKLVLKPANETSPTLVFTASKEPLVRYLKLRKGEVDVLHNDMPPHFTKQAQKDHLVLHTIPSASYTYIGLNLSKKPFKDVLLRKAFSYALNREEMISGLLNGFATEADSLLLPYTHGYKSFPPETYNPEKAKALLDEAGYTPDASGIRLHTFLNVTTSPLSQRIAQVIQKNLSDIGIHLTLHAREWGSFYRDVKKGRFSAYLLSWTGAFEGDIYYDLFHSAAYPPKGLNRGRYANDEMDALLLTLRTEASLEKQKDILDHIQKKQADEMLYIPLWRANHISFSTENIKGYTPSQDGGFLPLTRIVNVN